MQQGGDDQSDDWLGSPSTPHHTQSGKANTEDGEAAGFGNIIEG